MEQRPCYRLPVEIDVWLYKSEGLFAKARMQNVSRNGMFIRTDVMLLSLNSRLNVEFEICEGEQVKRVSFPVSVIHRCLDGIGVKIDGTEQQDEQSVISLLAQLTTKSYLEHESEFAA